MNETKTKIHKAIEWAKGVNRNQDSFTAGSNAAADLILSTFKEEVKIVEQPEKENN